MVKVKLDPEKRIIAAALDQAQLDDANERGAGARIEFKREGHAKVRIPSDLSNSADVTPHTQPPNMVPRQTQSRLASARAGRLRRCC